MCNASMQMHQWGINFSSRRESSQWGPMHVQDDSGPSGREGRKISDVVSYRSLNDIPSTTRAMVIQVGCCRRGRTDAGRQQVTRAGGPAVLSPTRHYSSGHPAQAQHAAGSTRH